MLAYGRGAKGQREEHGGRREGHGWHNKGIGMKDSIENSQGELERKKESVGDREDSRKRR